MASRGPTTFNQASKKAKSQYEKKVLAAEGEAVYSNVKDALLANVVEDRSNVGMEKMETSVRKKDESQAEKEEADSSSPPLNPEWRPDGGPMDGIQEEYGRIMKTIGDIQLRTESILNSQEDDLIRSFKAALTGVTQELEKEKKKNESGSVEWVEKCHKLTSELEWLRDTAQKLSEENKTVNKELRKLKRIVKQKEEDREYLIKQLVSVKKENAALSTIRPSTTAPSMMNTMPPALSRLERPYTAGGTGSIANDLPSIAAGRGQDTLEVIGNSSGRRMMTSKPGTADLTHIQEKRYRNVIAKLKKGLEVEQMKLRKLRAQYHEEISSKNELQTIFKQCLVEVRKAEPNVKSKQDGKSDIVNQLDSKARRQVIEKLMSNDKIVYLLYERMFPTKNGEKVPVDRLLQEMERSSKKDDDSRPWSAWIDSKLNSKPPSRTSGYSSWSPAKARGRATPMRKYRAAR